MQRSYWKWRMVGLSLLPAAIPAKAATIEITVEKLAFNRATVSAAVGDTIRWVNKDIMAHTATADGSFDIVIPAHQSALTVLTKGGALDYYCRYHPNMRARIDVKSK